MKVYTKVVIDMSTLEEVDVESFEYTGLVALCKGGGGGGGGTGAVSYPAYMETIHSTWLTDVDGYIDSAIAGSPFTSAAAYVPDTDLTAMDTAIAAFNTVVDALDTTLETDFDAADVAITAFNTLIDALDFDVSYATTSSAVVAQVDDNVISTTKIDADIAAYTAVLNSGYDADVVKLQSGISDIGATMSSAFTLAQVDLYTKKELAITEFGKQLYVELERQRNDMIARGIEKVFDGNLQRYQLEGKVVELTLDANKSRFSARVQRVQFESDVARLTSDAKRIKIIAKSEEVKENYDYDEVDARWDLDMTTYGINMLAGIGGGTVQPASGKGMSKSQSAMSGAMSGAAAGTMVMPGWGTAIGAVAGGIGGYLSA